MKPHRVLRFAVAPLLAAGLCTGCGVPILGGGSGDPNTLTALDYFADNPLHDQWGSRLSACGRKIGVRIDHQSVPGDQLVSKVLQQASSKTMPDLLMLNNPDVQQIADTGALTPLDRYHVDTKGFYPSILSAGSYQGHVYGLAPVVNALALYYNTAVFDRAGVRPPRTWADLERVSAAVRGPGRYAISFSAADSFEGVAQFLPYFWSNGAHLDRLDSPAGVQALTAWARLVRKGYASRSVLNYTQGDAGDAFADGKAAMTVNGPFAIPDLRARPGLKWSVAPMPTRIAGQAVIPSLGGEVWTVPVTSGDHQRKAARIVSCLTSPANELAAARAGYAVPSRTAVAAAYAREVPVMTSFVAEVGTARARTSEVGIDYPTVAAALSDAIQAAITGVRSPAAALKRAQRAVRK